MKTADTLLINGHFLTMEDDNPTAEALAIRDGKILFAGTESGAKKLADENTQIIDLNGHVAAPSFIESHTHPVSFAYVMTRLNCRGKNTESLKNLLDCIRKKAEETPEGEWIYATGFDEGKFKEGAIELCKEHLDSVAPNHPVYLRRVCSHLCVLNSMAMKIAHLTDEDDVPYDAQRYFRDENGHLTGRFSSTIADSRVSIPPVPIEQVEECFYDAQNIFFKNGVTTAADMSISPAHFKLVQKLDRQKNLKMRLGLYHSADLKQFPAGKGKLNAAACLCLQPGFGSENLWFSGIKFVMDGSAGGKTAAFSLPYINEPDNFGQLYYNQEEVNESILTAANAGVQAAIHAIGDRAIEMALTAIEYANKNGANTSNLRFRIEHLESPTADHIERMKKLNVAVSLSGAFIYHLGDSHINVMGKDRLPHAFPAKTLLQNNLTVACNSDCPVCDVNPMYGIYSMVTRTTANGQSFGGNCEAIDRITALKMYTKNAAYLLWCEDYLGTLKEGKFADIIVFDEDFLNVPDNELKDVHINMTMVNGEIVYKKQ